MIQAISIIIVATVLIAGGFFLFSTSGHEMTITHAPDGTGTQTTSASTSKQDTETSTIAENVSESDTTLPTPANVYYADIEPQKPLSNPPTTIKAVYSTSWTAATPNNLERLIGLIKRTELNAIVIDIKDFSGAILYDAHLPELDRYHTKEVRIRNINAVIKRLHDEGIYVIARQTVFQDPALAKARPDLALKNISGLATSTSVQDAPVWKDDKGLAWMDPAAKEVWDYNIAIAREASSRGFDEINFDYVRFASDGSLGNIGYPFYNPVTTLKKNVIKNFFAYLREETAGIIISADLFGLTTVNSDDLGIGQSLEIAAEYFDYVGPMTYPSHYARGFNGYKNPAEYPYEVLEYSMQKAKERLMAQTKTSVITLSDGTTTTETVAAKPKYRAKLRPWLQDFDLGADYDAKKVRAQISAVEKVLGDTPLFNGWFLWDPRNIYTEGALLSE